MRSLPAYQLADDVESYGVNAVMSPATAKAAGLATVPLGSYYSTHQPPSTEQKQKLDAAVAHSAIDADLHVESGYVSEYGIVLLALTVFAGLITLGAAGIATGLAQADAEADLRTLAAVGHRTACGAPSAGSSAGWWPRWAYCSDRPPGCCPRSGCGSPSGARRWTGTNARRRRGPRHRTQRAHCRPLAHCGRAARRRSARRGGAGRPAHPVAWRRGPPRGGLSGPGR